MAPEDKSKVDKLDDSLYSRTKYKNPLNARSPVSAGEEVPVAESWQSPGLGEMLTRERRPSDRTPFLRKFFLFAVLFFIATIGVAAFVFLGGNNFISSKNVNIEITGPTQASAGEPVELEVTIKNSNNADLDSAIFSVQFPSGARDAQDSSKQLTFAKEDLGAIKAGDEVVRNVKFLLIGQIGESKEIKFSVQYNVSGSKATFYKDKVYDLTIGSSPLSLNVSAPQQVTSGESFTTTVTVNLNSTEVLRNVMLRAEYPYGYVPSASSPSAFSDNNVWALGDLSPGATKKIQIIGTLTGENQDERTFRFYAGAAEGSAPSANFKNILLSKQNTVTVERPSVDMRIAFNSDDSDTYLAPAGQLINATVQFENNLPDKLTNPKLEVRFAGTNLDESTIVASSGGFYNSSSDRAIWNLVNPLGVAELNPGDSGVISFRFASIKDAIPGKSRDITLQFIITGTVRGNQQVSVSETRTVKVASQVSFNAKTLHSTGAFINTGSVPPQAEKETTYTIALSLGNTQGDLTDGKVTARLGPAVKWKGSHSDAPENISYDEASNLITWDVGTLANGAGFSSALREISFQVSFAPSASQIGTVPTLVSNLAFTGFDVALSKAVNLSTAALTTNMPNDPAFIQGDGIVVK